MAGDVTVRGGGWHVKDVRGQEVGQRVLPTMADTGEIDLRRFIRTVYRGKWILILTIVVTMAAPVYWMREATPLYSADVLIVVENRPSSIVRVDEAVQDISSEDMKVNTEVAVLESRGLATRVIKSLELDKDPEFAPEARAGTDPAADHAGDETPDSGLLTHGGARAILAAVAAVWESARASLASAWAGDREHPAQVEQASSEPDLDEEARNAERADAALLNRFLDRLSIEPEGESRLIRVGFTSTDPAKATRIANKVVDVYIESQLETKSEGARRAAHWLELRLAELGDTVRLLSQAVEQQREEGGSNRKDVASQSLAQLNTQLVDAQGASMAAAARYEQVRKVLNSHGNLNALPAVIGSSTIQTLRSKRATLIGTLSQLQSTYGPNHPEIISVQAEVTETEHELDREVSNILTGLRNEAEGAGIHEAKLRTDLEAASAEMVRLDQAEASIGQVTQRLQVNRDLYQNLLKRFTEAVALRENQQPDARIISPAQIPLHPSYPNFPRVIALSFVGSALLAVLLLVTVERIRQKLATVEDVEREVGLQVIGVIPDLPRLRRLGSAPRDYVQREPLSEFGGAFQRLRALLTLSNNRVVPHTVLVTSCTGGEGKTTIAVCLAIASISSGQNVLLVDCDFARPQVHRMLDIDNKRGLTDILKGTATVQEAITQAAGSSLSILTVGRSRDGAIDLLNSARMEALLAELKAKFDIIILDSAPVQVSNALILGGLAEKTIFVTRRDWTTRRKARYSLTQLQLYGADIAGVVFNRAATVNSYAA